VPAGARCSARSGRPRGRASAGVVIEAKVLRVPSAAVPPGDELAQVPASTAIEDGAEARPTKANPVETAPIGAPAAIAPVAASADSATAAATIAVDLLLLMALPVRSGLMTGGDGAVGGRPFAPWRPPYSSTGRRQAFSSRYEGTRGGRADAGLALAARGFPRRVSGRRLNGMSELVGSKQLLERDEQLARIEAALADARTGRGRFVVVEGPAGIGKTALLAEARTAAAEGGMRVLRSRATAMETNFAFGVVRQLFEPPLAEASELERADLLQAAAGVAAGTLGLAGARPTDGRPSPGVDPSFAIFHGLHWLCANLAAGGPLCVVVDDAHWADSASLRYLAFLLTRLEELDIALLVATRPPELAAEAELLATVIADPSADVIRLQPLTGEAVVQLLERELGRVPDPGVVDTCVRVTRGRPFLVRELVTALSQGGSGTGVDTVGRSVHLRLLRMPDNAGRLARALAILEQSDLLPAARLAGLEELEMAFLTI